MQLFSLSDTYLRHLTPRQHGLRQVCNLKRGNSGDKCLAAVRFLKGFDHQFHALGNADPETGHTIICNGQLLPALFQNILKKRDNGSPAARHISVSDNRKTGLFLSRVSICRNKQFIGNKFCSAI